MARGYKLLIVSGNTPSHTLPTGGAGKSFPSLTVDQFQKRMSVVKLNRESIAKSARIVETLAGVEGLDAHARSAMIRTEGKQTWSSVVRGRETFE